MSRHDAQMLKGVLSVLLLRLLADQEDYGYHVVVRLHAAGFPDLREGTVYPALARLESQGLLSSRLVPSGAGPARKYYAPTAAGTDELTRATQAWGALVTSVSNVLTEGALT